MVFLDKIIKYIIIAVILCFSVTYGQVNKTVGTRITDVTTDKALRTNAILDLESTSKGFFLPRMTTIQRDAIKKEMGKDNGLAIYNIDNDCVEYWSERATKWMSLCGTLPPAKLDLAEDSCESISFTGFTISDGKPLLKQGTSLNPTEQYMVVRLKVNQVGTYTISASSQNGYFFSGEGQFQAIGTYEVILKGMGTPIKGYDQQGSVKGDKLQFIVNGIDSNVCVNTEVLVRPADLDFIITNATYKASGTYNVGVPGSLKKGNSIEIDIKVNAGGQAIVVATNKELGMKFMGSKKVDTNDTKLVLEPVEGENIPKQNDSPNYEFLFEVNTKNPLETINQSKAELTVNETKIKALFEQVNLGKEPYYQGGNLSVDHTVELPVEVFNSGIAILTLKGDNQIEFKSELIDFTLPTQEASTQIVKFNAVKAGVLPNQEQIKLTLSSSGKRFLIEAEKDFFVALEKRPVAYALDCSTVKSNRGAIPYGKPVGDNYYITVMANVTVAGEYEINTSSSVDGIHFSTTTNGVKQVFEKIGRQEVRLYPIDKTVVPKNRGEYSVNLIANDMSNAKCSGVKIKVGYGDINVLLIKHTSDLNYRESLFLTGKNKDGKIRFGENGVFAETGEIKITTYDAEEKTTLASRQQLAKDIRAKKYNFIMLIGQHTILTLDKSLADALYDYTVNNDGVFFMSTTFYHVNHNTSLSYTNAIKEYSVNLGTYQSDAGLELITRFNDNQEMIVTNYASDHSYNMIVHDFKDPLTSEKNGYVYNKTAGKYRQIHWTYSNVGNKPAINSIGTKYRAIVTDRNRLDRGLIFTHQDYENLIWAPVVSEYLPGIFNEGFQVDGNTGEPFKEDYNGKFAKETDTAPFSTNLFIELISRLANK